MIIITVCQDFMNTAVVKFNKINATDNGFKGSVHIVQEDIVSLIAAKTNQEEKETNNRRRRR